MYSKQLKIMLVNADIVQNEYPDFETFFNRTDFPYSMENIKWSTDPNNH